MILSISYIRNLNNKLFNPLAFSVTNFVEALKTNKVFTFCYFTRVNKKRKYFIALGICTGVNTRRRAVCFVNSRYGVYTKYRFELSSPVLTAITPYHSIRIVDSFRKLKLRRKFELVHIDSTHSVYSYQWNTQYNLYYFLSRNWVGLKMWHMAARRTNRKLKRKYRL